MLKGKKVVLRPLDIENDLERYFRWINDFEVTSFLGKPYKPIPKERERELLQKILSDESSVVFAIDTLDGVHIGITGLHHISHFDGTAITGTVIGDKNFWSRGYGTDAKMLLLWYGFTVLNLRRVSSRVAANNVRSIKCQLKCGYAVEGIWRKELYKNGRYHDIILLAVFRSGWMKRWHAYMRK